MAYLPSSQGITARMNKPAKLVLGIITVIPAIYLISLFVWGFTELVTITPGATAGAATTALFKIFFALNGVSVVITLALEVFYVVDSMQNEYVPRDQRIIWALILLFMGIFAMPVYWYRFVWNSSRRQTAQTIGDER